MEEIVERFASRSLRNERTIWIRAPRERSANETMTVFLDAEFYRDRVGAVAVIDELGEAAASAWFVFVSMESLDARWVECPCHPPFATFVAEELLPWLETHFGLGSVRQRTLAGLSYTGLAAAYVAGERPGIFHRVVCQSGSFWWNDCWLAEHYRAAPRVPTEFYLDVGLKEVQENVRHREDVLQVVSQIEGVRRLRDALLLTGHAVRYVEFDGGHEFAGWRQTLPGALRWSFGEPGR